MTGRLAKYASNPSALPFLTEALEIASFEPGVYEVVETISPAKNNHKCY